MQYVRNNLEARKEYMRAYIRKIGRVKEYPCERCDKPCYKAGKKAYC